MARDNNLTITHGMQAEGCKFALSAGLPVTVGIVVRASRLLDGEAMLRKVTQPIFVLLKVPKSAVSALELGE